MKKIFLVFGLGCFFNAPAQQQDLFDIDQHLLKKNSNNNIPGLKKIPALPYQQSSTDPERSIGLKNKPSIRFYNGTTENIVPFNNMPCVRPDMNLFKIMPNPGLLRYTIHDLSFNPQPGDIPNAAWIEKRIIRK